MSYNFFENDAESGSPYYLYEFTINSLVYRYVNLPSSVFWNNKTWTALPITHSKIEQSDQFSKNNITIELPITAGIANNFFGWTPDFAITLTIYRTHYTETEAIVYWKGRIVSHVLKQSLLEFKCEPIFTSLKRPGLKNRYQRNCRHALYDNQCRVDKASYVVNGTLSDVNQTTLIVAEAAAQPSGWFNGGIIEFADGSYRMVLSHSGSTLVITRPSRYAVDNPTSTVKLYPGCNRSYVTCRDKFNNLDNNGGFRWIPSKNPFGGNSLS